MSNSDLKATLTQLEGAFGQRLRGVFRLVAEQVPSSYLAQGDNFNLDCHAFQWPSRRLDDGIE